jgi:HPt (histidine-containing phosphotransfer) domain-containing protein
MIDQEKNKQPLDLSYLSGMSGDSAEFMIEMLDMFKLQTPLYVAELEKSVAAKDWPSAAGHAHKIKPTLSYVGREDARGLLQHIENNAKGLTGLQYIPEAMEELRDFLKVLYVQLDEAKVLLQGKL